MKGNKKEVWITSEVEVEKAEEIEERPNYYISKYPVERTEEGHLEAWEVGRVFALRHELSTAVEYLLRAGRKMDNDAEQDMRKAITWIKRAIQVGELRKGHFIDLLGKIEKEPKESKKKSRKK